MSARKPVVVVGSINADLVAISDRIPAIGETVIGSGFQVYPGGKGANQAVAVARLGYPVQMIGCLGEDSYGAQLSNQMQAAGVDCAGVATVDGPSGVAVILVSSTGENCIVVTPGANAKLTPELLDRRKSILRGAGVVLAQLEIPMDTIGHLAVLCERWGVPLILDPAPAQNLPPAVFRSLAWLTPNESEAEFYTGCKAGEPDAIPAAEIARRLLARGCHGVLLKLGSRGAFLASTDSVGEMVPAFPVIPLDTTAAGDAFNGGFATGLMLGKSPVESANFAAAVAAISVTRPGAQPSMPSRGEVEQFLETHCVEQYTPEKGGSGRYKRDDKQRRKL